MGNRYWDCCISGVSQRGEEEEEEEMTEDLGKGVAHYATVRFCDWRKKCISMRKW